MQACNAVVFDMAQIYMPPQAVVVLVTDSQHVADRSPYCLLQCQQFPRLTLAANFDLRHEQHLMERIFANGNHKVNALLDLPLFTREKISNNSRQVKVFVKNRRDVRADRTKPAQPKILAKHAAHFLLCSKSHAAPAQTG